MGTLHMRSNSVVVPAVVLFDSGASHCFTAASYVWRHGFTVSTTPTPYLIDAPGANVLVKQCMSNASVIINEMSFGANLLVMNSKGIDIILGMNWLSKNKVVLDYA